MFFDARAAKLLQLGLHKSVDGGSMKQVSLGYPQEIAKAILEHLPKGVMGATPPTWNGACGLSAWRPPRRTQLDASACLLRLRPARPRPQPSDGSMSDVGRPLPQASSSSTGQAARVLPILRAWALHRG